MGTSTFCKERERTRDAEPGRCPPATPCHPPPRTPSARCACAGVTAGEGLSLRLQVPPLPDGTVATGEAEGRV